MNRPRLVKREEIKQQANANKPTTARLGLTQLKQAVQERKQSRPATSTNARAAFAALFSGQLVVNYSHDAG